MNTTEVLKLEQEKAEILTKFRHAIKDILTPKYDEDDFLLRWLKARDFDVFKAEKMIRKSYKTLLNYEAEDLSNCGFVPNELCANYCPTSFWGFDNEGSGVRCILPGLIDFYGYFRSLSFVELVRNMKYVLDTDLKNAKINAEKTGLVSSQLVYVLDFEGFNVLQIFDSLFVSRSISILQLYQDNLPELAKIIYCVNIPSTYEIFVNFFRPMMHDNTWAKCRLFSTDDWHKEIQKHVDPQIIPRYFGGQSDDTSDDPETFITRTKGGKIPKEYYLNDDLYLHLKETDDGMQSTIVHERSSHFHSVHVRKPGTIFKWVFQTIRHNIKFGVLRVEMPQENQNKPQMEAVVQIEMVESHICPERGELLCEKTGEYKLHFDNTYSWTVKKKVLFKVELKEPFLELTEIND